MEVHTPECKAARDTFDMALTIYRVGMLACARARDAILRRQAACAREEAAYDKGRGTACARDEAAYREALLASANTGVATLRGWNAYQEEHAQCKVRVY